MSKHKTYIPEDWQTTEKDSIPLFNLETLVKISSNTELITALLEKGFTQKYNCLTKFEIDQIEIYKIYSPHRCVKIDYPAYLEIVACYTFQHSTNTNEIKI